MQVTSQLAAATAATRAGASVVDDALREGRLLRSSAADLLDRRERLLLEGAIDESSRVPVAGGMNGDLSRVLVQDPVHSWNRRWVIEKDAGAQAAQEEFGWRVARELGIDHLVPAAMRRADGIARIEFREGRSLSLSGITDSAALEDALAGSYLRDATLGLDEAGARRAALVDRQLLQCFDYLLANNDRHTANGLYDATSGVLSFIDSGHAGRGQLASNGGSVLVPALRKLQAGSKGGHVDLDPAVVDYLRRRTSADRLRAIHAATFDRAGVAGPAPRTYGERFLPHARSTTYRDGIVARYEHVLDRGGYDHAPYQGDAAGDLPPLDGPDPNARGLRQVRAAFAGVGGGRGGFDRF
ncbi:MAG: hypothetical protein KDC46_05615 [Thermoleophilia bacterium]|nr:hypothetical protein [Thermoleophilia bacterium]